MDEVSLRELDELHSSILSLCEDICPKENHDHSLATCSADQELFDAVPRNEEEAFISATATGNRHSNYHIRLSPISKERKDENITPASYSSTFEDSSFEFHCNEYTPVKTSFKRSDFESTPKVQPSLMGRLLQARSTSTPLFNKWNQPESYKPCSSQGPDLKNQNFGNKIRLKLDSIPEKYALATDDLRIKAEVTNEDFEQSYDELLEDLSMLCQAELNDSLKCDNIKVDSEPKSAIKAGSSVSRISIQSILYDTKVKEEVGKINDAVEKNRKMLKDEETKKPGRFCGVNTTARSRTMMCVAEEHVEESFDILGLENFLLSSDDEDELDLTEPLDETILDEKTVLLHREEDDHKNENCIEKNSTLTQVTDEISDEKDDQSHDEDDVMANEKYNEMERYKTDQVECYKNHVNNDSSKSSIKTDDEFELDLVSYNDEVENFLSEEGLESDAMKAGKKAGIENKSLVQLHSLSSVETDEIDDFLRREGFQIIDDWKCDEASAHSPASLNSLQSVDELNTNLTRVGWSSPSLVRDTDEESGCTNYWPFYKKSNGNSVKVIQPSTFKNWIEVTDVEKSPLEKSHRETSTTNCGLSSLDNVNDKDVTTHSSNQELEDKVDTQNLKGNVCVDGIQNVADNAKKVCEVVPVKSAPFDSEITAAKESDRSSVKLCSNDARSIERTLNKIGAECDKSSERMFLSFPSPKVSKSRRQSYPLSCTTQESVDITACISPKKRKRSKKKSDDKHSRFDSSSHRPLKRRWSSSPPRNTSYMKIQPKPLSNNYTGLQEEKVQQLSSLNMHPCSSSTSSTSRLHIDARQHNSSPVQPEMVQMNQERHDCAAEALKNDMEFNSAGRPVPSSAAHWEHKSGKRQLEIPDSYDRSDKKQNTSLFIDYRAERQFIQNENHLTRQVMNKWKSKGIQSPDTNLTFATKLRQRDQCCIGRLEGQRHSTLWLSHNNNISDNKSNTRQQNSQSVMNDINNLKQQLEEVNWARKNAVDNVVQECGMEKHRLGLAHGTRTRELYLQQEMEIRHFQSQRFINPYFLQCQLLQLKCEHDQQKQQLQIFMCREQKELEDSYENKIHHLVKRYDERRMQLNSLINQLENEKFTKDQYAPHVLTHFKSNYSDSSKVTVCLPAEIAASLVREDEVYDSHYSY